VIEDLVVSRTKVNIAFGSTLNETSRAAAIAFAFAGMDAAAAQTQQSAGEAGEDVNLFKFRLNGKEYFGCTRRATFKVGDAVEVVFSANDRKNEVWAVKRPSTRSVWLYPYLSRGTKAAWAYTWKLYTKLTIGFGASLAALLVLGAIVKGGRVAEAEVLMTLMTASFATSCLMFGALFLAFAPRHLRFSRSANGVLAALGFQQAERVDLNKSTKRHKKLHRIPWSPDGQYELWY
jgi:hypothetical protein